MDILTSVRNAIKKMLSLIDVSAESNIQNMNGPGIERNIGKRGEQKHKDANAISTPKKTGLETWCLRLSSAEK